VQKAGQFSEPILASAVEKLVVIKVYLQFSLNRALIVPIPLFATVVTLLVVPSGYVILEDKRSKRVESDTTGDDDHEEQASYSITP
jgi:hypothetical protein